MMQYDPNMRIQRWLITFTLQILLHLPTTWTGFACMSSPCIHGVCLDDLNSTYFCYCIDGYTGIQCQTNWNECWSSPCRNGGVCMDGIATFACACPAGYTGRSCEEDINECESNPCQNNGTCMDAQNGYTCNCLPGYSGTHCEVDIAVCNSTNETRCSNGGICEEGPGDSFWCQCQRGWGGFLCDAKVDECASSPCQNGAVCIDLHAEYSCACLFGFTGQNCEEVMQICDTNPCTNGALCIIEENRSVCYCVPDFHGDLCQFQYDECQLGPRCMNGGTCIDGIDNFTCSCPPKLTGVLCECLILEDDTLDCTYVSPRPTGAPTSTIYYGNVSMSTIPTEVPTTRHPLYNETITSTILMSTDINLPITSTLFTTSEESTMFVTIHETPSIVAEASTDISSYVTSPYISTTSPLTEPYSLGSEPTTQESSTTYEVTKLANGGSTTPEETSFTVSSTLMSSAQPEYSSTSYTSSELPLYQNMSSSTTAVPQSSSTLVIESTTPAVLSSSLSAGSLSTETITASSAQEEMPGSRTFPEESTSLVSTFFTTEPTSTLSTIVSTTFESITEETTAWTSIDCTKYETKCQNGGTCVFLESGYKCICQFDHEGIYCENKLGIRHAAFNGNSYLSHRIQTSSYHIAIEFEAKTMANDGLLFYCNIDSPHMALYMERGHLKFRFSCGYQTMLLSELKVPVNNGFKMNIKAGLEFSKDLNHCNASIRVNDSLSMTGDQVAKIDRLHYPSAWLHLGGLPQELSNEVSYPVGGLFGCISNLKIDNHKVRIYDDAEDGNDITECSSLACLSNPCSNGASCSSMGDKWQCHCRNGYLGKTCHISICDDNPCLYGGTCIPFTNSGYICLCPYGKHGHFCENDLKVTEPNFSSTIRGLSSFVAYPFPDGISKNMELSFKFIPTTMEQISLLLFIGQAGHHDYFSDHIAVSFVKGYIMLTWNLGSGPRRIFTAQPIKKNSTSYLVKLGHTGRRAWLYVENIGNITGRTPGNLIQLDVVPLLYIGGHDAKNFSTLPHDLPLHTGFSGCIFDIEMKSGSVVIPFQGNLKSFGRSVGQCGTSECYERSCQNEGACLHHGSTFMCLCQDEWYSPLCSSKHNLCDSNYTKCSEDSRCVPLLSDYECDCPLGKTGRYCERAENISDVSLTGKRSYFALNPIEFDDSKFHIEFDIRVLKDRGVVLFVGRKDSTFLSVSLLNQMIEIKIRSGKGGTKVNSPKIISVRSSKFLVKGLWHKVKFGVYGRKIYISVDNVINTGILDAAQLTISKETIFFGGLPDLSHLPLSATSSLSEPFQGCLKHLSIDGRQIPLDSSNIREARNIGDCAGTPCGGEACQHGGSCWLDSFLQPHCACVSPFYGEKCAEMAICDAKSCKNRGKCLNNKCTCQVGFAGAFCENQIVVKTPEFRGKSYLRVKRVSDRKRDLKDNYIDSIQLNFTTASRNGLLLWNQKGNISFGLGLENGFLKLAITIEESRQTILEIPSYVQVADGLWHHIEIILDPLVLNIDGEDFLVHNKLEKTTRVKLVGDFFIGGVPANYSLISMTKGLFPQAFEGCISGFGTNLEYVSDFSRQEGSNITTCDFLTV